MINKLSKQRTANRKRKGKGIGSGLGKTAGRGHKGQKSRSCLLYTSDAADE